MPRWRMVIGTLWSMWRMTSRTPWVDGHVWSESFPSWKPIKALLTPSARDPLRSLPPPSLPRLSTLRSDLFITSKNLEKWSSWSETTMSALLHYAHCGKILYFGIAFALSYCFVEVVVRHKKKDGNQVKICFSSTEIVFIIINVRLIVGRSVTHQKTSAVYS